MIRNDKGIALIVVLILSTIALALVGATLSLTRYATNISGSYIEYQTSLEAAKGGADLSIAKVMSLPCDNSSLSGNLPLQYSKLGRYNITSKVLKYYYPTIDTSTGTPTIYDHCIYSLEITAQSGNKKSIIDTIVKVE